MKILKEFENIHLNEDIYVIASGPSLEFIDKDFFNNKITIGINQIYKTINTNYLVRKEHKLLQNVLDATNKSTIHFISKGNCGADNSVNINFIKAHFDLDNIVVYNHNKNTISKFPKQLPHDGLVVSWSTITTGIHLAAYMGAKNIILVGHDCGILDNKTNVTNYHNQATYKIAHKKGEIDYRKWLPKIENQTITLKKMLKEEYNCNVYSLNPFINFGLEGHKYSK